MLSGLFIYNHKGEVLLYRLYRDDTRRSISDLFRIHVVANPNVRSPVLTFGSTTFFYVRNEDVYFAAVTKQNVHAALVFEFLYKLVNIGIAYFGKLKEETIKNNYTLVYELLDEIVDYGYPQNTEIESLKLYITQGGISGERLTRESQKITMMTTGAIPWRKADLRYRRNECFIDVVEGLNLIMSNKGSILKVDVSGAIVVKAFLSGMPECKLGLNDKMLMDAQKKDGAASASGQRRRGGAGVELDDCQFHQCVRLGRFDVDRTISFIPPDGEFEVMKYRTTENINLPFRVHAIVNEIGKTRVEYKLLIKATFNATLAATDVQVHIPTPSNTANVRVRVVAGRAKYKPGDNGIRWRIGRFQGQMELSLSAEAELSSTTVKKLWSRPPISLDFQVPMFAASGLHVKFLRVYEKSNYQTIKWVRYITKAGSCQYRI